MSIKCRRDFMHLPKGSILDMTIQLFPSDETIHITCPYDYCNLLDDDDVCEVYGLIDKKSVVIMEWDGGWYCDPKVHNQTFYNLPVVDVSVIQQTNNNPDVRFV